MLTKLRQSHGGRHPVIGQGKTLWHGSAPGAGFGTVLCDTTLQACEHFTTQPWAEHADAIHLNVDNQHFYLYRSANGWVLPANGRPEVPHVH